MFATRSKAYDGQLEEPSRSAITQSLARASAFRPWRVLTAWGLILAASVVAIGTLLGSAFTSDGSITSNPDSAIAEQVIAENFSQADRIDDAGCDDHHGAPAIDHHHDHDDDHHAAPEQRRGDRQRRLSAQGQDLPVS